MTITPPRARRASQRPTAAVLVAVLLAVLVVAVGPAGGVATQASTGQAEVAETRVRVHNPVQPAAVGTAQDIAPGQGRETRLAGAGAAIWSRVAPRVTGGRGPAGVGGVDPSGVPARSLDYTRATINNRGADVVEAHLRRFTAGGPLDAAEDGMLMRLRKIAARDLSPTDYDLRFYTHELRESVRYRRAGYPTGQPTDAYEFWDAAHTATLSDYGIGRSAGENLLYHPSVAR